jgi:predicted HNH restriction endonuclease
MATGPDENDDDAEEFPEGRILLRLHRARERSPKLRELAKRRAIRASGHVSCIVCGFDFAVTYGLLGDGYIECHHTKPVSELAAGSKTNVEDVALLCANCHRMVHRRRPWLTLGQLADLLPRGV